MKFLNKYWATVFGVLSITIIGLLILIFLRFFAPTVNEKTGITSLIPVVSEDSSEDLIISYYQAVKDGDINGVRALWWNPNSRQARYAVQAMQDFPNARCHPQKVEKTSPDSESDAFVSVVLECSNLTYPVIFHLKASQPKQWKILELQTPNAP